MFPPTVPVNVVGVDSLRLKVIAITIPDPRDVPVPEIVSVPSRPIVPDMSIVP